MWLFTRYGFYSVVQDSSNTGSYLVRARFEGDLERLIDAAKLAKRDVPSGVGSDYEFRISVDATELHALFVFLASDINYPNFKEEQHRMPDDPHREIRGAATMAVWEIMYDAQEHACGRD